MPGDRLFMVGFRWPMSILDRLPRNTAGQRKLGATRHADEKMRQQTIAASRPHHL